MMLTRLCMHVCFLSFLSAAVRATSGKTCELHGLLCVFRFSQALLINLL